MLAHAEKVDGSCAEYRDSLRCLLRAAERHHDDVVRAFVERGKWPDPWPFSGPERAAFAAGRRTAARLRHVLPVPGHIVDDVTVSLVTRCQ
jgi:hypothetical protein